MSRSKDQNQSILLAIRQLYDDLPMIEELKSKETSAKAMEELGIDEDAREAIINLVTGIEQQTAKLKPANGSSSPKDKRPEEEITKAQKFFDNAIKELQEALIVSKRMSVIMFIVGIGFLLLAGFQAIINPENVATTSVVGGIGIAQIVVLFYRKPLADIARAVSNAQQAKVAIASYLIGNYYIQDNVGLGKATDKHLENLLKLTENTINQLKTYKE
jgi:uncharacterized membrane protein (DUF485 family)